LSHVASPVTPTSESLSGVRCVAFDAVNTLIVPNPPVKVAYFQIAQKYGSRLSAEVIAERFQNAFRHSEEADRRSFEDKTALDSLTTSEARERQRWESIVRTVLDDVADPAGCFVELFDYFGRPGVWRCYPDVGATIALLHRRGIRTAIASNFDDRLNRVCDGLPELRPITVRAISSLVGYRKPSSEFYRSLVTMADCRPGELLMIGDDYENDVQGARRAGLAAIHLQRQLTAGENSISDLRQLPDLLPSLSTHLHRDDSRTSGG
jgi:putative hydrolase of the HAD superfamily